MDTTILPLPGIRQPFSAFSHYFGLALMLYTTALLFRLARSGLQRKSMVCFGVCACLLYGISAIYHTLTGSPKLIQIFRRLDFSAIFLLIAGTWTALFSVLPARLRRTMLLLVWSVATLGILGKWILPIGASGITLSLYILLAILGFLPFRALKREIGWRGLALGALGGLFYLIGGTFDALKWPTLISGVVHAHELLHILDLLGTGTHVMLIIQLTQADPARAQDFVAPVLHDPLETSP